LLTKKINEIYKDELIDIEKGYCVSLYTPVYVPGNKKQHNKNKFSMLMHDVRVQLQRCDLSNEEISEIVGRCVVFFSKHLSFDREVRSLALFFSKEGLVCKYLLEELPNSIIRVGREFYLDDLEDLIEESVCYFLLKIFKNEVAFYKVDNDKFVAIKLDVFRNTFDELCNGHVLEKELQFHITSAGSNSLKFHGNTSEKEFESNALRNYIKNVTNSVNHFMDSNSHHEPLVLATTPQLLGLYKEFNHYNGFVSKNLPIDRKHTDIKDVLAKAHNELVTL
jgi:hypothetical protein